VDAARYLNLRAELLKDGGQFLIDLEKSVMLRLLDGLHQYAAQIKADFDLAMDLRVFWELYAPLQRGHKPRADAFPWGEVGEKVVEAHLYSLLDQVFGKGLRFPGIPCGHDVRFLTDKAFVQIDVKSTGPTDNADEIVSSPNQVTGDGRFENNLVMNTTVKVVGKRSKIRFRPELSPFVAIGGKLYPVLTYYIKTVYEVKSKGDQPLKYMELACVPNGLLMFDGPHYHANNAGLLIPGKDEQHFKRKRTRIRLEPLAQLDDWRCIQLRPQAGVWSLMTRSNQPFVLPPKTA
jgi:hypothetical protein